MKYLFSAVALLCGISAFPSAFASEQQILFCADSISFRNSYVGSNMELTCGRACREYSSPNCLQEKLDAGWVISSSTSKGIPSRESFGRNTCSCVGTQYVLNKSVEEPKPLISINEMALTNKEIELLKRENEILKKEAATLKLEGIERRFFDTGILGIGL